MATLQELLAKRAALEEEIQSTQKRAREEALQKIKLLMEESGLTLSDLAGRNISHNTSPLKGSKVSPKYRNPATGETWSGRGLQPKWLQAAIASGKKLTDFSV